MTVSGISSGSNTLSEYTTQGAQSKIQQFRQEFQQLGQDLTSGNLTAARADFALLQPVSPQVSSTSSAQSNNPIAQEFNQLSQDLQAGDVSAAQQDYTKIQQDFQNQAGQMHAHHKHHGGASKIKQLLDQAGQALLSGKLSAAQQAYSVVQQVFQNPSQSNGLSSPSSPTSVSVNA